MRTLLGLLVAVPLAIHARPAAACDDDGDVQVNVNVDVAIDVDIDLPDTDLPEIAAHTSTLMPLIDESVDELEARLDAMNDHQLPRDDDRDDDDRDDDDRDDD